MGLREIPLVLSTHLPRLNEFFFRFRQLYAGLYRCEYMVSAENVAAPSMRLNWLKSGHLYHRKSLQADA